MPARPSLENTAVSSPSTKEQAGKTRPTTASRLDAWLTIVFYGVQAACALALFTWQAPHLRGDLHVLLVLAGLNILAGLMPVRIYGDTHISTGFVFTLTVMILFGVPGAVILATLAGVGLGLGRRTLDSKVLRNISMFVLVYSAGAASYGAIAEVNPDTPTLTMALGGGVATAVSFTLNAILLAVDRRLHDNLPFQAFWEQHTWLPPHYAAMGMVGVALASAYSALGLIGIIAFLTPAAMMRLAMKQYVDKTADNVEKLKRQNEILQQANVQIRSVSDELQLSYDGTLEALVNALDARDQETKGHSIRVSHYMLEIAREMSVREGSREWIDMQRGSLLHDVGKIGVSDSVLLKPSKLTPKEWGIMRRHPEIGYNMLHQVKFLEGAAQIILTHHERWDGQGYPRGLHEEEIPLGARIFAVVDTFDSMTSDRPYRKAVSTMESLNEILRYSGSQFDPLVVEAFLDIYETWVKEREQFFGTDEVAA